MKYNDVCVTPLKGDRYKLNDDLTYKDVVIPKGYRTNGANIPKIFWSIYPPNKSDFMPAVIIHDYLCDLELYGKADTYFEEILTLLNCKPIDIMLLTFSVKIYHKWSYPDKYNKWS